MADAHDLRWQECECSGLLSGETYVDANGDDGDTLRCDEGPAPASDWCDVCALRHRIAELEAERDCARWHAADADASLAASLKALGILSQALGLPSAELGDLCDLASRLRAERDRYHEAIADLRTHNESLQALLLRVDSPVTEKLRAMAETAMRRPLAIHSDEVALLRRAANEMTALRGQRDESRAEVARLREALEKLCRRVDEVVPYVVATLPKPCDGHPDGAPDGWGTAHMGRSGSSIVQLENLRASTRAALTATDPGTEGN